MKNNPYFICYFVLHVIINMRGASTQSVKWQWPLTLSFLSVISFKHMWQKFVFLWRMLSSSDIIIYYLFFTNLAKRFFSLRIVSMKLERSIFSPAYFDSFCMFIIIFTNKFISIATHLMFLSFICVALSFLFALNFTWNNNVPNICINNKRCNQLFMITLKFNKCIRWW